MNTGLTFAADHDLRADPEARQVRRLPSDVDVCFAAAAGSMATPEGPVCYAAGAALLRDARGRCWPVERPIFDAHYSPVPPTRMGDAGRYRHEPQTLWGRQIGCPFRVYLHSARGVLEGAAGDWLMQYAPGELGVVSAAAFRETYESTHCRGIRTN